MRPPPFYRYIFSHAGFAIQGRAMFFAHLWDKGPYLMEELGQGPNLLHMYSGMHVWVLGDPCSGACSTDKLCRVSNIFQGYSGMHLQVLARPRPRPGHMVPMGPMCPWAPRPHEPIPGCNALRRYSGIHLQVLARPRHRPGHMVPMGPMCPWGPKAP